MAEFQRGKIRFENIFIATGNGRAVAMFELDCSPPPTGTERNYNYGKKAGPSFQPLFLQQHEMPALISGAQIPNETLDSAGVLKAIADAFLYTVLDIDDSKIPANWKL